MAQVPATSTAGGDYDYPDDFTDSSDDQDLPLPGLGAPSLARPWPGGEDWLLPGIVNPQFGSYSSGSNSSDEDGQGEEAQAATAPKIREESGRFRGAVCTDGASARLPAAAAAGPDTYELDPWAMELDGGSGPSGPPGASGLVQTRFTGSAVAGGVLPSGRLVPTSSGRALFGPFGSSSLQHRDSLQAMQPHPLTLTVQHNQIPPPPTRPPPTPVQQQLQPFQLQELGQQRGQREQGSGNSSGALGVGLGGGDDGGEDDEEDGGQGQITGGGGNVDATTWSFLDPDPFALGTSSSCSSSRSASPGPSPRPHPAAAQPQPFPLQGRRRAGVSPQPWYDSPYGNPPYERNFGTGLSSRLPRRSSSSSVGVEGFVPPGEMDDGRRLSRGLGSFGLGLGVTPEADNLHGSGVDGSSDGSHSGWAERSSLGARYEGAGPSLSQSAAAAMVLWPLGPPSDVLRSPGVPGRPVGGPVGALETEWPLRLEHLRHHRHAVRARPGELGRPGWSPEQDLDLDLDEGEGELRASMAGTSSLALRSSGEPSSWERRYGGLDGRGSYGLSLGGSSGPINRHSPRSTLGDSDLSGLGPSGSVRAAAAAGSRAATPAGLSGGHRAVGYGGGGGVVGSGSGGATLCFTSLDSPPGPYDRRRIVLTSARRRAQPEATTPGVRQYSDGLAGMLTNAQIQEWMSQHASRLLLPRHMQEIADIVFRPPSAVPEKKPLKCQPGVGTSLTLPPPVVLSGRYAPLHISRLVSDPVFIADLLRGLPGVDPASSRLQAVVTALAGKDVIAREEGDGVGMEPGTGLSLLTKSGSGLGPGTRISPK